MASHLRVLRGEASEARRRRRNVRRNTVRRNTVRRRRRRVRLVFVFLYSVFLLFLLRRRDGRRQRPRERGELRRGVRRGDEAVPDDVPEVEARGVERRAERPRAGRVFDRSRVPAERGGERRGGEDVAKERGPAALGTRDDGGVQIHAPAVEHRERPREDEVRVAVRAQVIAEALEEARVRRRATTTRRARGPVGGPRGRRARATQTRAGQALERVRGGASVARGRGRGRASPVDAPIVGEAPALVGVPRGGARSRRDRQHRAQLRGEAGEGKRTRVIRGRHRSGLPGSDRARGNGVKRSNRRASRSAAERRERRRRGARAHTSGRGRNGPRRCAETGGQSGHVHRSRTRG